MVKTLLLLTVLIFSVAGLCELIYYIKMIFYFPGKRVRSYTLIFLEPDRALRQLEFMWQKICWHGEGYSGGIIAICDALETKEILNCLEYIKNKNIAVLTASEISGYIDLQGELSDD